MKFKNAWVVAVALAAIVQPAGAQDQMPEPAGLAITSTVLLISNLVLVPRQVRPG